MAKVHLINENNQRMINVRPGTDRDKPQILERIAEVFGEDPARRAERLWHWQWHQDPRLPVPGYRGIVAEWKEQIIGNLSTIPAGLYTQGNPLEACWTVDVLVHWGLTRRALRDHKRSAPAEGLDLSRGIAAVLFDHPSAGPIQLAKHISDPMMAILERIGFSPQPDTGSQHRRVSTRYAIGRILGTTFGDWVGSIADLALPRIPHHSLLVEHLDGPFDTRFDALWERVNHHGIAVCRRDRAVLEWRYRQHPDQDYLTLILDAPQGLRGYCVIKVFDRSGRRRGKIVDLLTAPGDSEAPQALLIGALGALRRGRVERVECFAAGPGIGHALARLGFTPRLTKTGRTQPLMTRHLPQSALSLYVTQGDGDGG